MGFRGGSGAGAGGISVAAVDHLVSDWRAMKVECQKCGSNAKIFFTSLPFNSGTVKGGESGMRHSRAHFFKKKRDANTRCHCV